MPDTRIVLMPQGMPARHATHEALLKLLLACGADIERVFDSPTTSLERFASHVSRAKVVPCHPEPLVVLTKASQLAVSVILTRRVLQKSLSLLRHAAWIIFSDPEDNPFFSREALSLGVLDDALDAAPIWTTRHAGKYLVLTPTLEPRDLRRRVEDLLTTGPSAPPGRTSGRPGL